MNRVFYSSQMILKALKKLFKQIRLNFAIDEYNQTFLIYRNNLDFRKKKSALTLIALYYNFISFIVDRRIANQTRFYQKAYKNKQRLSFIKKQSLISWILQIVK